MAIIIEDALAKRNTGTLSKQDKPLTVGVLEQALLATYPAEDAEDWGRTGITVGDPADLVRGVAVALDPTVEAVRAASAAGANVLLTHHPAFIEPIDSFRPAASVAQNPGALVWAAIKEGVSLLNYHTALDVSADAQQMLPGMLSLRFQRVLEPLASSASKGYGQVCAVGEADGSLTLAQLAARCTSVFGRQPRVWGDFGRPLSRIVTTTGSAGDLGRACLREHVDCLVAGEVKYHEALALAEAGLCIIELGHDVSELPFAAVLAAAARRAGVPEDAIKVIDQGDNWTLPESTRM